MKEKKLEHIVYINLPEKFAQSFGDFKLDTTIPLPIELPLGQKEIDPDQVTIEAIVAAMLTIIAYRNEDKHFEYYKNFVLAAQPTAIEELNVAAIAKQQQKDYEFSEELFLAVYHMLPQAASCINLAMLYSFRAKEAQSEKNEKVTDFFLEKALHTLEEGLEKFGEDEQILAELGSYEAFLGNIELAQEYLERYMKVGIEGEKKQKLKKLLKDIQFQVDSDTQIKQAYDFMMLQEEEKALEIINKFLVKNPKVWQGHFIKAWALRTKKEYDKAEESLLECLKLGEKNAEIYNELSICALEKGDKELAKNYLDIAIEFDEENLTYLSNLAYLYLTDKQFDEAKEWIEKARKLAPEDKQILDMMEYYSEETGESFGPIIQEEYVKTPDPQNKDKKEDKEDDGYEEELEELENEDDDEEDEEHHCHCHDDGDDEHHCHCHDEEDEEHHCHCHDDGDDEHHCHCHDDK